MMVEDSRIRVRSGILVDPCDMKPDDIHITDIAHALSMQCRFSGHTYKHYSVAQHSLILSRMVPEELSLTALLHDSSEAYLVDVPRPLKHLNGFHHYRVMEDNLMKIIGDKFGIQYPLPAVVHEMDRLLCDIEIAVLFSHNAAGKNLYDVNSIRAYHASGITPRVETIRDYIHTNYSGTGEFSVYRSFMTRLEGLL